MADAAVSLENMRKSYRGGFSRKRKTAVEDISLEVAEGDIFGLLGPNGAGKTTTLKVLLGIVCPDSGGGSLLGKPLGDRSAHYRVGFLPEQPYFQGFLTAEKALEFYGRFFGMNRAEIASGSARLLDLVGLRRDSHMTFDKYSKGMLQRFGIAQALLNDPDLIMMDEPSSGLDPIGQKEVRDILLALKGEGKTIFLSSHQLSELEAVCDSVSIINRGVVVREGALAELLAVEGLTRITVTGVDARARERITPLARGVEDTEDETLIDVERANVHRVLDVISEQGLDLVSLRPYRRSLEDLFLEAVKETPD